MTSLVIFGDSISHGGADGGWPIRLRNQLWHSGRADHVYVQAIPGNTSCDLKRRMPIELPLRQSETILLAIGTNDAQVLGDTMHPRVTDQEFTDNLSTTISLAKQYARWVIPLGLFGLFPPQNGRSSNRWIPPERHHTIDQLITQVAAAHQCWHIPFGNLLPPEEFFPDGVHPNAAGHDRIARHVWEALRPTGCLGLPETVPAWGAGTSNDSAQ